MACPSPKSHAKYHFRSISLPSKLHPSNSKIEEKLKEFESWSTTCTSSSGSVLEGLSRVKELYNCLEEVLHMKSTRQTLSKHRHEKSVEGLLEGSVKILDVCTGLRELGWQIKEHIRELQSAIRRWNTSPGLEVGIARFAKLRRKVKKDAKRVIASLKQMGNEIEAALPVASSHDNNHLLPIIRLLREVHLSIIPVFLLLLSFLTKLRPNMCSVISRMMHRQEADVNELESIGASLKSLRKPCKCEDVAQLHLTVRKQLGHLELTIGSFDDSLECLFRRLIRTRASLLNIISH